MKQRESGTGQLVKKQQETSAASEDQSQKAVEPPGVADGGNARQTEDAFKDLLEKRAKLQKVANKKETSMVNYYMQGNKVRAVIKNDSQPQRVKTVAESEQEHMTQVLSKSKRYYKNTAHQDPLGYNPDRLPELGLQKNNSYNFYDDNLGPEELKNFMRANQWNLNRALDCFYEHRHDDDNLDLKRDLRTEDETKQDEIGMLLRDFN